MTYLRLDSVSLPSRFRVLAKYVATLAVLLCLSIGQMWGADFTPAQIVASGGTTTNNVKVSSSFTGTTSAKVCNESVTTVSIGGSANANYNTNYIEIQAASGYTLDSPIEIYCSVNKTDDGTYTAPVVFWEGEASASFSSYTTTTLRRKDATTNCGPNSIVVPAGTRTVRIYRLLYIKGTTITNASGYSSVGSGQTTYIKQITASVAAAACTAPDHVNVTGRWDRFAGETINLTATAYDGSDAEIAAANITGYQWQKLEGSTWTNVSNGTVSGATTTGATAKNLQITNCGAGNSGKYRCVVSTGATCSTPSATKTDGTEGFGVKVYVLECYNDGTKTCSFTRTGDTQAGTATLTLAANTAYTFKFHVDNTYYGNNASINTDITNYVFCNSDNGGTCASNFTVNSGLGGTFTFAVEYSTGGNSSVEGEPELSVTYPRKTIYLAPNSDWLSNSAKFAYYYFHKTGDDTDAEGWTGFLTADDCGRHADIPQWNGVKVIAVRFNSSKTSTGNWDDKWNQTDDITVTSNDLITITGWNNSQTYTAYSPSTYTITFAGNGNTSGSMTNVSSIPCGEDRTLADNAFVKTDNIFDGWKANVDVTIGGANVTAGTLISDGATLQNIHSNITLTAQWTACSGPTINSFVPSGKTDGTYPVGTALGTLTVTASAGNGGALSYLWYQYDGGNIGAAVAAAGTNNAATYSIPNNAACVDRHYYCVVSEAGCSTTRTSDISGALTLTAPELTALECNTLYTPANMLPSGKSITSSWQKDAYGLSGNTKFFIVGAGGTDDADTDAGIVEIKTGSAVTISGTGYSNYCYFKKAPQMSGTTPTSKAIKFILSGSGSLDVYGKGVLALVKEGGSPTTKDCTSTPSKVTWDNLTAGTYYLYATGTSRYMLAMQFNCCTTPDAPTSPTNGATTSTTQAVSWTDAGNDQWEVYVSTSSSTPGTGQTPTASPTSASYTFTGLTASTTYYWWVRSVCDASHKSSWVAGTSFTTSAAEVALVTWTMNLNTATWGAASTATTDGTNISSIATSRTGGGSGSSTYATAKVSMASAEVTDSSEPSNSAQFTFTIASGKKVEPEKVTCQVFNVSSGSRTYKAQISDSNGHVYNSTNTLAVSAEASLTDATFNFASGLALTGNVTLKIYAWGSGSDFRMGESVKLFGEVDNYTCTALNLTRGGQENGTYTVGNYTGNPLTCTVNAGEPASYQWKQYTLGQGVGDAVNAVGSGSTTTSFTPNPASANTYFYACQVTDICGNSATTPYTGTFVFNAPVHHDVEFTLTNVTYSSGDNEGTDAATEGSAFSTVFAASSGYVLPSTITVTIGGSPATVSTDYTWNSSTGALEILAASVTGDITVTIVGDLAPATKDIYYGHVKITDGALVREIPSGATQFFTNIGGTVANNTEISLSSTPSTTGMYYNSNNLTDAELSKSSNWSTSSGSNRYIRGLKFANGTTYTLALGSKVASSIKFYGWCGSASKTMTVGGEEYVSSATKNTFGTNTFVKSGGFTGNVSITQDGDFYGILVITIQTATPCTTPVIPALSNQSLCEGTDIAEWDATQTAVLADGETVTYSWKKKGNDTELANTATFDLGSSATESQAGTYVVTVTVSKAGKASSSAYREVELSVTDGEEVTSIVADKATVYPGNSVTLTATANTPATWQWYTCTNAEGAGAVIISGAESASYTIASAGAAGTYYYKAVATGSCGTAERVYTLTVTAASECQNYYWFIYADDATANGVINNRDGFFSNTTTGTGNTGTYTMTVDGTSMTGTKRLSTGAYKPKFTVPAGATATLYIYGKAASSDAGKHLVLKRTSDDEEVEVTSNTTVQGYTKEDIEPGEWTLSCGSSNWCYSFFAVKVCSTSSCTDATPTIAAVNNTVCSGTKMRIDATGYETGATFKWQKLNTSTSSWDDVAGATLDSLVIASVTASNAGSYRFIATKGCARTSNTVTIAVPSVPVFGEVPSSVSVMQTLALSISNVEASDAVSYKWYKSADATFNAGTDTEIGSAKNLVKAYADEAVGTPSYYVICRATNSCGTTTSSAIAVNVTEYVEEECAVRGNENDTEFGFENNGMSSGTYDSKNVWYKNSNSNYLTYTAPEGKYFATAKVTIANSGGDNDAGYAYSTDGGSSWTGVTITGMSATLTEKTFNLPANVDAIRIGRKVENHGSGNGTFYLHKACFTYTNACTTTTVTPSTSSKTHTIGNSFTEPTFTVKHGGIAFDPQPTITYSSSDEDIATVDDDGTVTFQGMAGTVKIIASYAGGTIAAVDYCASEGYYTITVSCSAGAPKIVADGSTNLAGCNTSVTLNAKTQGGGDFSGGSYQWYRGGEEIDGATSASITVTQTGTYTVEYTKDGCTSLSTNSISVTSESVEPEVERLVPFQYYHVDKTYTAQMKMRHLFAVKNSSEYGSTGRDFKLEMTRNGSAATDVTTSNAIELWPSADRTVDTVMIDLNKLSGKYAENDELVFTCKAIDCEGDVSEVYKNTITMRVIGATPTLALICSGSDKEGGTRKTGELTVGGDFLTGYNKADLCEQTGNTSFDASTEWGLYTRLKANYIVTPVNGYAIFNKLNYEPFDILLLTDYPKASKSDAAKDVLDDMADLCDYRPLLSFKAHMVAKSPSKWAAKGFTTEPVAVKQGDGRTHLNIVCYAHPMFDGIKDAGDHIFLDNSEHSHIVYEMLTGAGYESDKGIQGFEIAAAENFVTIGLIHYNASVTENSPSTGLATWTGGTDKGGNPNDRMLVAAAERQTNPEARMVMLAVNCGAQSKFTETGRTIVHKCLQYLLSDHTITPMADCSFTFDNGAGSLQDADWYKNEENCPGCTGTLGDGLWSTAANWSPDRLSPPGKNTEVKIAAPVTVDMDHAVARSARIVEGGHITIPAGKALEIVGTIRRLDGSEISPTDNSDIFIGSTAAGNGTLIFNNDKGDSKATVAMYTTAKTADPDPVTGKISAAASTWQYIGTPHNDVAVATYNYYDSWLYQYDTGTEGWTVIPNGGPLVPFRGYCVTHPEANHTFVMGGKLTATTSQEIAIPAGKFVVVANSWTAPIYVKNITAEDMENTREQTIYFFNTGSDSEQTGTVANGTYVAVPVHASSYTGDSLISSMQGFYVVGGGSDGTLHLDYERHVRPTNNRNIKSGPMHAPQHYAVDDEPIVAKLFFRGSRYSDRLVVLERADFSRGFDNGWDGEAWGGNDAAPYSCVSGENRWDAVSAIPDFEGTVVGFQAGEDNAYTIDFEYSEENAPLYLYDTEAKTYSRVLTGNAYYFTTSDKDYHDRFIFTRTNGEQTPTGVEPTSDSSLKGRAKKLLIEEKLFILLNGVLYDATGKVVK